jgi:hypothetical protein
MVAWICAAPIAYNRGIYVHFPFLARCLLIALHNQNWGRA